MIFVFIILILYRLIICIPIPNINLLILNKVINYKVQGLFGIFDTLTGGGISKYSILSLSIMPYISSSIILQLLSLLFKDLSEMKKNGKYGKQKIHQYSKIISIILSLFQSYSFTIGLENLDYKGVNLIINNDIIFRICTIVTLMSGTSILVWMSDLISIKNICSGISVIIFTGITSEILPSFLSLIKTILINNIHIKYILIYCLIFFLILLLTILIEKSSRKILIQYPHKKIIKKQYITQCTYFPIKINITNAMPSIFTGTILLIPNFLLSSFFHFSYLSFFRRFFQNKIVYNSIYGVLIIFFCFFYNKIIFNSKYIAENLNKSKGIILKIRPGKNTSNYIEYVNNKIVILNSLYMLLICFIPDMLSIKTGIPLLINGVSLLIVVNIIMDALSHIQGIILNNRFLFIFKKFLH